MQLNVFSFGESPDAWSLLDQYFELRRKKFVTNLGWSIWSNHRIEIDQYDNPNTAYSLVHLSGKIVAGARLIPSDKEWHGHRNLLVDAHLGRIPSVPPGFLPRDFDFSGSFECSRLVIDESSLDTHQRTAALQLLVDGLVQAARKQAGSRLLSLSPPPLVRRLRSVGYQAEFVGRRYECPDDARAYRVLSMSTAQNSVDCAGKSRFSRVA